MAHYKRGKCRYHGKGRTYSETFYRKRHGLRPVVVPEGPKSHAEWRIWWGQNSKRFWPDEFNMLANWPRAWDILHHTRPRRARDKRTTRGIRDGRIDPDEAIWSLEKKPHIYYW